MAIKPLKKITMYIANLTTLEALKLNEDLISLFGKKNSSPKYSLGYTRLMKLKGSKRLALTFKFEYTGGQAAEKAYLESMSEEEFKAFKK
jgi:hypothetical protein